MFDHHGGGEFTVREFLKDCLIDELHLAVLPVRLESGERIFEAVGDWPDGYVYRDIVEGEGATHYTLAHLLTAS